MPGQKISKSDRERIDVKFICSACDWLLNEPVQTSCGHLLCSACLQALLSSSNPVCPKDGTTLKREEVFPDAFTKRELMALRLQCSNNGCEWLGTYKELQDHSSCCDHALIQCVHTHCKKEVKRSLLAQHLKEECKYRLVQCDHCKEELPFISLKKHVGVDCLAAPVICAHCGKSDIPRAEMKKHEMMECEEVEAECDFKAVGCTHQKVAKRRELRHHFSTAVLVHVGLLLNFILELFRKVQALVPKVEIVPAMQTGLDELRQRTGLLSNEVRSMTEKISSMLKALTGLEKRVERIESEKKESGADSKKTPPHDKNVAGKLSDVSKKLENVEKKNRTLENELQEKTALIDRLRTKLDQLDHSMALTTVKLSDMSLSSLGLSNVSYNGTLLWRIDGFKRKRDEALSGVVPALYSPHFYSSQFGYKMCARIYMNGDGFGKDTHISLFFVVMRGEYDALLTWPFQKKITMMLLDQGTGDHVIDSFRSDPQSSSFQRPKSEMNIASGSPLFMAVENLKTRSYVRDDTMFIKVIVD